ncbi:MAG: type I-D CRISPR-associated protein Cas7/Csc2 [Tolypothrix carrinoi HA7290-LM1]|jgi:CRISPR-associated protein Csc2|nr:type I-D CRISPR-associated protein Cas7/Csc2 [Tolypothrix carrinoi HA7290-LM1]
MKLLESLKPQFQSAFPRLATGKYIHFIMLRHSQSFPVLQTDGILNTARTQAGVKNKEKISRLVMFKRKQTTPERLAGRELLRGLNLTTADESNKDKYCEYNMENKQCKKCPDCIIYGFAIGDGGSERSKVYSDSAFSLSAYEQSHRSFTFNALSEAGTMNKEGGEMRHSINELDHVLPEVTFPTIETLRDTTYEGFIYVLGNLLRTKRYGAQESRTGTMKNYIAGIAFCDGEIFSNLHYTQTLYDALKGDVNAPIGDILHQVQVVTNTLLNDEPVRKTKLVFGSQLDDLLDEVSTLYQDEAQLFENMTALYAQTKAYAESFGALKKKGKKD